MFPSNDAIRKYMVGPGYKFLTKGICFAISFEEHSNGVYRYKLSYNITEQRRNTFPTTLGERVILD